MSYRLYNVSLNIENSIIPVRNVTLAEIQVLTALHGDEFNDPIVSIVDTGEDCKLDTRELYESLRAKYAARRAVVEKELGGIVKSRGKFVERAEGVPHLDAEPEIEEFSDAEDNTGAAKKSGAKTDAKAEAKA